ncbi:MAG: alpha/beta fold hydrolase [Deltaproteobacteria bacterium]|nr:alpha/beta fold hydrolase [Candidatus Zymogenaceae bacterium]
MKYIFIAAGIAAVFALLLLGVAAVVRAVARPVPARKLADYGDFVTVDGVTVHLWEEGRGHRDRDVPVILVHGFAATNWCWRHTIPALSGNRWVLSPDLPGFGLSDKPGEFDYSLSGYARFIAALMDEMEIDRAVLVGNSMGGGVAVRAALDYPDRVQKLVLVDSLGYYKREFEAYRFIGLPVVRDLVMSAAGPRTIGFLLKARVYHDPSAVDDETIRRFAAAYQTENGRKAPVWVSRGLGTPPMIPREDIRKVTTPTLVIWGEKDRILPVAHAGMFGQDIAGSTAVVVPGVGHVPHEEQPEAVNRLILEFLERGGIGNSPPEDG